MEAPLRHPLIEPGVRALIVGLGRSGQAAARLLARSGARVVAVDRGRPEGCGALAELGVEVRLGEDSPAVLRGIDVLVVSPGVPLDTPIVAAARRRSLPVVGELGLALGFVDLPVVAVTGTNGKSTVTSLIAAMLAAAGRRVFAGGNLGTPLAEFLLAGTGPVAERCDILVLEVSSFQLDTVGRIAPRVGVLLNVSPDHLDRYESYDAYVASKKRLFAGQGEEEVAVLNADDPVCAQIPGRARRLYFSGCGDRRAAAWTEKGRVFFDGGGEIVLSPLLALGPNPANVAAAALAAGALGAGLQAIQRAVDRFQPLDHRLAVVTERNGVTWVDDSKATNTGAVAAALAAIDRPVVLIVGGRDKGGDYRMLAPWIKRRVKAMVCIGEAAERIIASLGDLTAARRAATLNDAVAQAAALASPGDVVLLSPACASFDMFSGYAERGRAFRTAIAALMGGEREMAAADRVGEGC